MIIIVSKNIKIFFYKGFLYDIIKEAGERKYDIMKKYNQILGKYLRERFHFKKNRIN